MKRGTGETTRQLKALPLNGIFIWVHGNTYYPKQLCKFIGREDIRVVSPFWIMGDSWRGERFSGFALDHAYPWGSRPAREDMEFQMRLQILETRIRP